MHESKLVSTLLGYHTNLLVTQSTSYKEDMREMKTIPYANTVKASCNVHDDM